MRLESNDYRVITATNGKEALRKIEEEKPDAVLLDIMMPGISGLEVLKRIRKKDKLLPVFMITAFSDEQRFKEARALGASGFIVKTSSLQKEVENLTSALRLIDKYRQD
ncbi:MAG: response regulator [Candidatus Omnitrophica bacterium]|nr:response regulator [Candidatus Omnitrophota bacterium]